MKGARVEANFTRWRSSYVRNVTRNKNEADERGDSTMEVQLGDLAVEVIRLRLRNDYAWARERKRVRE